MRSLANYVDVDRVGPGVGSEINQLLAQLDDPGLNRVGVAGSSSGDV